MGEEDSYLDPEKKLSNFWLADTFNVTKQGFTMKVDNCRRWIKGVIIKNMGMGLNTSRATREFRVFGASLEDGPWQFLV